MRIAQGHCLVIRNLHKTDHPNVLGYLQTSKNNHITIFTPFGSLQLAVNSKKNVNILPIFGNLLTVKSQKSLIWLLTLWLWLFTVNCL